MTDLGHEGWIEAVATAHVYDWRIGEARLVDSADSETAALLAAGLLVPVDSEIAARYPPPAPILKQGGCGCGK